MIDQSKNTRSIDNIRCLTEALSSAIDGDKAASLLIGYGQQAVPLVFDLLMRGKPSSIAEPRKRAVRVLAAVGAKNELIHYLQAEKNLQDPVLRFSEESVESLAAESLGYWPATEVFDALFAAAQKHKRIGLCVAFGQMCRPEAIPLLIRDLGDGLCSRAAEESLRQIGQVAASQLISSALSPEVMHETELPSSAQRRKASLRLLHYFGMNKEEWQIIRYLIHDRDPEISARACLVGLTVATQTEGTLLASRMLTLAARVNWLTQSDIQEALIAKYESIGWVVREYASVPHRLDGDMSKRLAMAVISKVTDSFHAQSNACTKTDQLSRLQSWLSSIWHGKKYRKQNISNIFLKETD